MIDSHERPALICIKDEADSFSLCWNDVVNGKPIQRQGTRLYPLDRESSVVEFLRSEGCDPVVVYRKSQEPLIERKATRAAPEPEKPKPTVLPDGFARWGDANYYSDAEVKKRQALHAQQLAEWEASGEKAKWEERRKEEQPTVEEKIALSRRVLSEAPGVKWLFRDGEWKQVGSLAPNVIQVSFSFVDLDGNAMDGSGKPYIIRKAKRILEHEKQSGRWIEIHLTPVSQEEKFLLNYDTEGQQMMGIQFSQRSPIPRTAPKVSPPL